ncbi:hypothetical protein BaRGS_00002530 [Batillaria attramentaria]|uniref:G-protein coupled receptors family 1 profile domain-containing protein n=1 Tax=Batillaria attramentaria TaxID=370345 RepID=A0ABD0M5I3_9CAEN
MSRPAMETTLTPETEMVSKTEPSTFGYIAVHNSSVSNVPEGCVAVSIHNLSNRYPDDLISLDTFLMLASIHQGVIVPIFFPICFSTNIINMVVFYKHGLQERINLCVFCLAVADIMHLLGAFLTQAENPTSIIVKTFAPETTTLGPLGKTIADYKLVGLYGFNWASQLITVIVVCERCYCVVRPLKSQTVLSTKNMAGIIVTVCTPVVAGYFVVATRWDIVCTFDSSTGSIVFVPTASKFYLQNRQLVDILNGTVYGFAIPGFCMTVVTVLTIITVVKLKQMAKWREATSSAGALSAKEVALTRMLVGTSILFISCAIPVFTVFTTILFVPGLTLNGPYHSTFSVMVKVCEQTNFINSSFNFFVYYKFGTKFRETVRKMFHCGRSREPPKQTTVCQTEMSATTRT